MREGFQGGTLPADVSAFVAERCRNLPADVLEKLRTTPDEKTGTFDTHPSDADRVRAATAAAQSGVIANADVPAVGLFRDFDALSEAATRHHFEHDLGLHLGDLALVDTNVAMRGTKTREENGLGSVSSTVPSRTGSERSNVCLPTFSVRPDLRLRQ